MIAASLFVRLPMRALLLFAVAACAAPDLMTAPPVEYSAPVIPTHARIGIGSHGSPNEAQQLRALGVSLVRVSYYTSMSSQQYDAEFEARLLHLQNHGLEPLIVVPEFVPSRSPAKWMQQLTRRFPGQLWQVENEGDGILHHPARTGAAYAAEMRAVLAFNTDTTARFVGMGLATTDGHAWATQPDVDRIAAFTREYLANGGPTLSAWCVHTYGIPLDQAVAQRVAAVRQALRGRMPIWITEIGLDRAGMERVWPQAKRWSLAMVDSVQAEQFTLGLNAADRAGVERVYAFQFWTNDDDGFGFSRKDATTLRFICARLVSWMFQRELAGTPS